MATFTLLGGPPGLGKTTVAPLLAQRLEPCAWVDVDDLWRIHPFEVTPTTKKIVESNLIHHVRAFLEGGYPQAFAVWVLHRQDLIERLLAAVRPAAAITNVVHLTAPADELSRRVSLEPARGRSVERALERLGQIEALPYARIDTGRLAPDQVADLVFEHVRTGAVRA